MATFNKFNQFVSDVAQKVHNLNSDVLKIMLTDTAPVASNTVKSNISEISASNGYTAGGGTAAFVSGNDTAGTYKLILSQVSWTASGGSIAQFRYAVLYNSTPVNGNLIGWWDYGTPLTITNGNTFTVSLPNPIGTIV